MHVAHHASINFVSLDDQTTPVQLGEIIAAALNEKGINVTAVDVDGTDTGHGIIRETNRKGIRVVTRRAETRPFSDFALPDDSIVLTLDRPTAETVLGLCEVVAGPERSARRWVEELWYALDGHCIRSTKNDARAACG